MYDFAVLVGAYNELKKYMYSDRGVELQGQQVIHSPLVVMITQLMKVFEAWESMCKHYAGITPLIGSFEPNSIIQWSTAGMFWVLSQFVTIAKHITVYTG